MGGIAPTGTLCPWCKNIVPVEPISWFQRMMPDIRRRFKQHTVSGRTVLVNYEAECTGSGTSVPNAER
jgi:hypothetical protein